MRANDCTLRRGAPTVPPRFLYTGRGGASTPLRPLPTRATASNHVKAAVPDPSQLIRIAARQRDLFLGSAQATS
jgi:hypothetical protein